MRRWKCNHINAHKTVEVWLEFNCTGLGLIVISCSRYKIENEVFSGLEAWFFTFVKVAESSFSDIKLRALRNLADAITPPAQRARDRCFRPLKYFISPTVKIFIMSRYAANGIF